MKQYIIIIIIIIIIIGVIIYKVEDVQSEEENRTEEQTISQHFIKMFRDVSPWPGVSQASMKSMNENKTNPVYTGVI